MKNLLNLSLVLFFSLGFSVLHAQKTAIFTEANLAYKNGETYYQEGIFGLAMTEYKKAVQLLQPVNEPESQMLKARAELGIAKSAVRLELPDGEKLIEDFIRKYQPDPIANQALVEMANYFFNAKKYDKAIEYFAKVPTRELSQSQRSEVQFKMGYAFFVQKKFSQARANFKEIRGIENEYYYPSNYYYGLCEFFEGNYNEAVRSFRLVEKSKKYKPHIPYYIAQIYFAQGEFDKMLEYVEPKLNDTSLKRRRELYQLVGQTYFELKEYEKALPYLEYYADNGRRLTESEFYQLGYAQYVAGKYQEAVKSFEQLDRVDSELGQYAQFYRGDSYLKLKNKTGALLGFQAASQMDYDAELKEDALFLTAKLSYELGNDRQALIALQKINKSSKYYREAQSLMSDLFVNTRDYERALRVLEGMENKTPELKEAYQKVAYFRGQQLYQLEKLEDAKTHFKKSLTVPANQEFKALAKYWLGDIAHQQEKFSESAQHISEFLALAKTMQGLPDESSVFTANYLQGYNYLKQKSYAAALNYFQDAVAGIKRNSMFIRNQSVKQNILGDAIMRGGDCHFKRNQYPQAVNFYDEAINGRFAGFEYALYQKAIIEGLRGRDTEKILALENLVENHPNSNYADDALFQLGQTYTEMGQLSKAVQPLRQLTSRYSNSNLIVPAYLSLGLITYNQGSTSTAIEYYKKVFSHNPEEGQANSALAALEEIYVDDLGDPDGYAAFLETVPGYKLGNAEKDNLNFKAAESAFEKGNYSRAITGYTDYIRKFPNGRNILVAHYHRGESYVATEQWDNALADYEWVERKGQSKYYLRALEKAAIISYHNKKDYQKAYQYYTKLEGIAQTPEQRFDAQLGSLSSAYKIGNTSAVSSLARKVANNPAANNEQIAIANFYLGKVAFDKNDFNTALSAFEKVKELSDNEETAEARYLVAYIYYAKRNLEKAKQLCIAANKESSNYPYWVAKSIILLSDIFVEQDALYNAKAALEALLENYNGDPEVLNEAQMKLEAVKRQLDAKSRLDSDSGPGNFLIEDDSEGN